MLKIFFVSDRPISWAMIAPSVTPKRTNDGPNNPGLRLYKFDQDTGQVSYETKKLVSHLLIVYWS